MCITVTEKDLRELHIRRAARVIQFKRACRVRAKTPDKMPFSTLSSLRNLIDEAEEQSESFSKTISVNTPLVTLAISFPNASRGTTIPLPDETYENHSHNHADPRFIGRLQLVA